MISSKLKIIVIGGGPAGLMAAGQAALSGARVTLLEKKDNPARKLRLTGNGRCNISNTLPAEEFIAHFGRNGKFLRSAFGKFFMPELRIFFESIGIRLVADERGRIYPKTGSADNVADTLLNWTIKCGVTIIPNSQVTKISVNNNHVECVRVAGKELAMPADKVIIATGGASYPSTGSTGDGYKLAESLGHTLVPIRPACVPLVTDSTIAKMLQGISLESVSVKIMAAQKSIAEASGDLLFTHFGISGPVILTVSRACVDLLKSGIQPILEIDLLPEYDDSQLDQMIRQHFAEKGKSQVQTVLKYILPQRMAPPFLSHIGIDSTKFCNQITSEERRKITMTLKKYCIAVTGYRSFAEAMVTAGGVSLKDINPQTMESRLIKGLYFAGEVLDLDADTGGFNLQAAFSTGWLAGKMC